MADDAAFARKVRAAYEAHNLGGLDLRAEIVSKYKHNGQALGQARRRSTPGRRRLVTIRLDFRSRAFDGGCFI